jgi:parallel beta-helix repeat protein
MREEKRLPGVTNCKRKATLLTIIFFFLIVFNFASAQQIYINEFMASNTTINPDIVDFDDYSDWVEIYNAENYDVDLSGYHITDNLNRPTKWQIPDGAVISAKGFIRLWADGMDDGPGSYYDRPFEPFNTFITQSYHLNFKLSRGGEDLGISDPQGTLIDSLEFGIQIVDISYGRQPDGSSNWYYFGEPTPGSSNVTPGTVNTEPAESPTFSIPGGIYSGNQTLSLSAVSPTAVIRYTTDGSRPTSTSNVYVSNFTLNRTVVLRARVYDGDKLPGLMVTNSYIIDENPTLPVVSLTAFPETLWDTDIGIYTRQMKTREIPTTFEFYEPDGSGGFNFDMGLRISGQGSYQYPQKPLTLSCKDRFGVEEIPYQVFPNVDVDKYADIYFRNSGTPDNRYTLFRDALQHSLVINQMDVDCQAYRPAMTFINGQYWGIYNLREKINANFLASHHNIDPNNIDYLEYDFSPEPVVIEGDVDEYNALLDYLANNDLSIPENYEYVKSQIDIDEIINYIITEIYCDNVNWGNTNVRWWREKAEGAKWRWILVDFDWGFGIEFPNFSSHYTQNTIGYYQTNLPEWSLFLVNKLFDNDEFEFEFAQRFAGYLNTTFKTERVLQVFDSLKTQIDTEMSRHIDRWNDPEYQYELYARLPIPNMNAWNADVAVMREFAVNRTAHQWQHLVDVFQVSGTSDLTVAIAEPGFGKVMINGIEFHKNFTNTFFIDIPMRLTAVPKIGYRFVRWEGIVESTSETIFLTLAQSESLTVVFEASNENTLPASISANTTLTLANSPYISNGDVTVAPNVTFTIEPGVEIRMAEGAGIYVNGNVKMNGNAPNPILIGPNKNAGATHWGALCIVNATDSSSLSYVQITGATEGADPENQMGAISVYSSTVTIDNVTIEDAPFPIFIQYGRADIRNCTLHSDKICDLINIKYADYARVENCLFRGNVSFDTDAIDYDQIEDGIIRGNRIYNFYGVNSDGIDLGEDSRNILIEDNLIFNCADKGISVGQTSTAVIKKNVIVNCAQGVGIKDESSYAYIASNTFFGNDYAVACFEKNIGVGGGSADVVNCIFSQSKIDPYFLDDISTLNISYSLSDTDELPGTGNIKADPMFATNFRLSDTSPAIDTGNPGSPVDPDGSRADIGAYFYENTYNNSIIINEIHFNPAEGENYEFVELYNTGNSVVDLSGYSFTEGIDFTFPTGSSMAQDEYIIIARNADTYNGLSCQVFDWDGDPLPNNWSTVQIKDNIGAEIDLVDYYIGHGWPSEPDGAGPSLELRATNLENFYYLNWRASFAAGGTPGQPNVLPQISELYINEFMASNNTVLEDDAGDFDDWIEIYNGSDRAIDIGGLYLTDDFTNPDKYKIPLTDPDATTIQPHDYLILWADEERREGIFHTNFQLSGSGEQIGLVQIINNDTSYIDQIEFGEQSTDVSYGRYPDGESSWQTLHLPSPEFKNIIIENFFGRGILVVNGVNFEVPGYLDGISTAYENHAFWGDFPIEFWDCFNTPTELYPATLPEPIGHGFVPDSILFQFSTIVWVGNRYGGDLECWQQTSIDTYLEKGGNLVLLARFGYLFITANLMERLGIWWSNETPAVTWECISVYEGLQDIALNVDPDAGIYQSLLGVFESTLTNNESTLLFQETASFSVPRGLGVWNKPESGGTFDSDGGQFVFISGRPYWYDANDLRVNMEYILENFFNESVFSDCTSDEKIITHFSLKQNYPNPFNPETTIRFDLPRQSDVQLKIYNIQGKLVRSLSNKKIWSVGSHTVFWDGKNDSGKAVSSGIYFYKLKTKGYNKTRKMLLLK